MENLDPAHRDRIMELRPVWYRSTCPGDNPDWSYYGLIAEEVAEIDPRLVQFRTTETAVGEDGERVGVPLAEPIPEGVMYDRIVPHLIATVQKQQAMIESLKSRLSSLEG